MKLKDILSKLEYGSQVHLDIYKDNKEECVGKVDFYQKFFEFCNPNREKDEIIQKKVENLLDYSVESINPRIKDGMPPEPVIYIDISNIEED